VIDYERDEAVFVGSRSAIRTGSGPWDCEPAGTLATPYDPARVPSHVSELVNRGKESLRGRPVWRVFVTGRDKKLNKAETINYYVGQHDFLPIRAVVSETITAGPSAGTTTRLVVDYSLYGEPVVVKLPSACGRPSGGQTGRRLST
jgi:hypothetical protein